MSCYCQLMPEGQLCVFCETQINRSYTWSKLSSDEKAKAIAYKRIILTDKKPSKLMSEYINLLHEKYEGFGVEVIP